MSDLETPLIQLAYVSQPSPDLSLFDVHNIVHIAQQKNRALGISGILSFGPGYFFQALEGDANSVSALMNRISQDDRHSNIRLVHTKPVEGRLFPSWSMAYVPKPMLFEILQSSGVDLDWLETEYRIRDWDSDTTTQALTLISREPRAFVFSQCA